MHRAPTPPPRTREPTPPWRRSVSGEGLVRRQGPQAALRRRDDNLPERMTAQVISHEHVPNLAQSRADDR